MHRLLGYRAVAKGSCAVCWTVEEMPLKLLSSLKSHPPGVANLSTGGGCNSLVQCAKLQRLPFLQQPATKKLQILVLWNFFFGITGNTAALASESQGGLVQPLVAVCMPAFAVELSGVGGVILASSEAPCAKLQVRPFVQNPMTLYLHSLVLRHLKVPIPPYEQD